MLGLALVLILFAAVFLVYFPRGKQDTCNNFRRGLPSTDRGHGSCAVAFPGEHYSKLPKSFCLDFGLAAIGLPMATTKREPGSW